MTYIGLLSDTHGFLDPTLQHHFQNCHEIWHAGDIGSSEIPGELNAWGKQTRFVYGNIDPKEIRLETVEDLFWSVEGMDIFMTHIAGYPGRYNARVLKIIRETQPDIVVCGHSHILKVIYDKQLRHLHINPGACGRYGLHQVRTAIRFAIDGAEVKQMEVIELGNR